jgi:hypothetical protein
MITVRPAAQRGHTNLGWLDSRHTFSFGDYFDATQMGFGHLRVINEDRVEPATGFGTHGHRDMEILSVVLSGTIEHKDSMGNGSTVRPGEVQRMSAGTGVTHSEFNPSKQAPVHFLQIWIVPDRKGLSPSYEQKTFPEAERTNRLRLLASNDGRDGSVTIHQDAAVYGAVLEEGREATHRPASGRRLWIQVIRGRVAALGALLREGDGAAITGEAALTMNAVVPAEFLLFDLA